MDAEEFFRFYLDTLDEEYLALLTSIGASQPLPHPQYNARCLSDA